MPAPAHVTVHPSQFPARVERDLLDSLRTRRVNHKFHYDSVKQTQKWLALHRAYSPSRTDADCAATYDRSFEAAVAQISARRVHLVGLGCGGGQKDTRLLQLLRDGGGAVSYTPSDVSVAMVLVAQETAAAVLPAEKCSPLVCDLASAEDLPEVLDQITPRDAARLVTFFGMIPNFEPEAVLPRLSSLIRPSDSLLFSANLAPGSDYAAGVKKILPLYDNALTRDWLVTFLTDLGVEPGDGALRFVIEANAAGVPLLRVAAYFEFARPRKIGIGEESFEFAVGEQIRLFFSYRHTPLLVRELLSRHGLRVMDEWITPSAEEGVFLCRKV